MKYERALNFILDKYSILRSILLILPIHEYLFTSGVLTDKIERIKTSYK